MEPIQEEPKDPLGINPKPYDPAILKRDLTPVEDAANESAAAHAACVEAFREFTDELHQAQLFGPVRQALLEKADRYGKACTSAVWAAMRAVRVEAKEGR